jgi:hypothetical protein
MAKEDLTFIPHVVINPSSLVTYSEVLGAKKKSRSKYNFIDTSKPIEQQQSFLNSSRKAGGNVSIQAKRKISKAIEYLVTTSTEKKVKEKIYGKTITFKCAFVTLTLPSKQAHPDTEIINKCLNSLLIELTKYHCVKNYIWRAEKQQNGNIHFHILIDKFVAWYELRNRWNRIVNKLGYTDRFKEKHGHKTPNSTDIHSTRKIKNLKAYLAKYLTKQTDSTDNTKCENESKFPPSGRIWGCNHALSKTRGLNLIIDSEIDSELRKITERSDCRKYEGNYFTVYFFDFKSFLTAGSEILFKYFADYLFRNLNYSFQFTTPAT